MTRDEKTKQAWAPGSGDGFEVSLSASPRARTEVDGKWVTPPCNAHDHGGVSGSSGVVAGAEREISIGTTFCIDPEGLALACSAGHTRGYLQELEKDAALALCKSIKLIGR